MGALALIGRILFAFLFLSSGAQKLSTFNLANGGPTLDIMAPKLDHFFKTVEGLVGQELNVPKWAYVYALGIAIFLELAGGILFVLNSTMGAYLLILFMVSVTPTMHAFWTLKDGSEEQLVDMIQFFKNLAILGALLFFVGQRKTKLKIA